MKRILVAVAVLGAVLMAGAPAADAASISTTRSNIKTRVAGDPIPGVDVKLAGALNLINTTRSNIRNGVATDPIPGVDVKLAGALNVINTTRSNIRTRIQVAISRINDSTSDNLGGGKTVIPAGVINTTRSNIKGAVKRVETAINTTRSNIKDAVERVESAINDALDRVPTGGLGTA